MKLYVWDNFVPVYRTGLAMAIAESQEDAKDAIYKKTGGLYRPAGDADIYDLSQPVAYYRTGCE